MFEHKCRTSDGVSVMRASAVTGVPITSATAEMCSCGAVLRRELTPAGWQNVGWGVDIDVLYAELDHEIVRHLQAKASWRNSKPTPHLYGQHG